MKEDAKERIRFQKFAFPAVPKPLQLWLSLSGGGTAIPGCVLLAESHGFKARPWPTSTLVHAPSAVNPNVSHSAWNWMGICVPTESPARYTLRERIYPEISAALEIVQPTNLQNP